MKTAIEMKERPILFSGAMVRAILAGRKIQTRRVVKEQDLVEFCEETGEFIFAHSRECPNFCDYACGGLPCPYGKVGDRLWVRETWAPASSFDPSPETGAVYRADHYGVEVDWKWKPSIHMPRWASRIMLEITGVRVERLQEIGKDGRHASDVKAEGLTEENWLHLAKFFHADDCPAIAFSQLWESINGKGSWSLNPWVWVVEFKRVDSK